MCSTYAERAQATDPAIARVRATERQVQSAVTRDQAIVVPVTAATGQSADSQELTIGRLIKVVDVDGQAISLNHAAVGPAVSAQGQATASDEAAAGTAQLSGSNVEDTGADVQHVAADVQQTTGAEAQVAVGAFNDPVAVVEHAADGEGGFASAAQCAQLASLVVEARCRDGQGAFAFDDAQTVV